MKVGNACFNALHGYAVGGIDGDDLQDAFIVRIPCAGRVFAAWRKHGGNCARIAHGQNAVNRGKRNGGNDLCVGNHLHDEADGLSAVRRRGDVRGSRIDGGKKTGFFIRMHDVRIVGNPCKAAVLRVGRADEHKFSERGKRGAGIHVYLGQHAFNARYGLGNGQKKGCGHAVDGLCRNAACAGSDAGDYAVSDFGHARIGAFPDKGLIHGCIGRCFIGKGNRFARVRKQGFGIERD